MVRVADYVMARLAQFGVRHIFMITGGGAMHLNDAAGKHLPYICNHHEQASAIAAEGYARATGEAAVVLVTTGPGGLNTLTGVMGQWTDSVPVLYISGQVKYETSMRCCPQLGLRQLGDQEVDIVEVVKPLTKYAACVTDPLQIRYELEKAWHLANDGRPGPVWLDIPINVQSAQVDVEAMSGFAPEPQGIPGGNLEEMLPRVLELFENAERPLLVAGHGIRLAGGQSDFYQLVEQTGLPVVTTFNGFDLIPSGHPQFIGRIGTIGDRPGNFALQNADLVVTLGSRNNIRQTSYNWGCYARSATVVSVDIDLRELNKPTFHADLPVCADVVAFMQRLQRESRVLRARASWQKWLAWCAERKKRYPTVLDDYRQAPPGLVNPYWFVNKLSGQLVEHDIVTTANGTASVVYFQAAHVKSGQRVIWNSGCAAMGYGLSAAIGAAVSSQRRVICIEGDGSLQMNLQELQTLVHYRLPVKLFVLNNNGYHSIRQTQENFFTPPLIGCDPDSGVSFPDLKKLVEAYGLPFVRISGHESLDELIRAALDTDGPSVCEVMVDPAQPFSPKVASVRRPDGSMVSRPLEDMAPFLPREELPDNLLVKPLPESDELV